MKMNMHKKRSIIVLAAASALLLALTGCGRNAAVGSVTDDARQTTAQTRTGASAEVVDTAKTTGDDTFSDRDLDASYDADAGRITLAGEDVRITEAGTYILSGTLTDGQIVVEADKEAKIQLVLDGVSVTKNGSAALYIKQADKVFVTLADGSQNTLASTGSFTPDGDINVDAAVFSRDDITFNGSGALTVSAEAGHGIVGKDEVTVAGGNYTITAAQCAIRANDSIAIADGVFAITAGTDGLHAENDEDDALGIVKITGGSYTILATDDAVHATSLLQIDDGSFEITAAEGMEATYILINGGSVSISASDDGVNAANKSSAYTPTFEITGGTLTIVMGAGDTDGVDSNGDLIISGGTIDVTGNSTFDYDGTASYTGGVIIVNGQQVSQIPNQMMGGGMGGPGGGMGGRGGFGGF